MWQRVILGISLCFLAGNVFAEEKLNIVTSFSILQDITQNITLNRANVSSIVPKNTDAHSYQLTPKNLVALEKSNLIIISGLGFEGFLQRYLSSSYKQKLLVASQGIDVIKNSKLLAEHEHAEEDHMHHLLDADPHVWQNPLNGIIYVNNILQALCQKDPQNCQFYTENAENYKSNLKKIDEKYSKIFADIPKENRIMITTHNAFNYLAERYQITVYSALGLDNNSEATAKNYILIKNLLSNGRVTAVFLENIANNRILEKIKDNNATTPILFSDALSNDESASSYLKLLEHNLELVSSNMHKAQQ